MPDGKAPFDLRSVEHGVGAGTEGRQIGAVVDGEPGVGAAFGAGDELARSISKD
jgi:hypothetical protein